MTQGTRRREPQDPDNIIGELDRCAVRARIEALQRSGLRAGFLRERQWLLSSRVWIRFATDSGTE
jgi:hypothetical protein